MIISELSLKNWRNFRQVHIPLAERVFVIGPNASGKSNLLDVFRFLRDIAKPGGGLEQAIARRGGLSKIRCLAARKEPEVEIAVELSDEVTGDSWRYEIGIIQEPRGRRLPKLKFEKVWKAGRIVLSRPDAEDDKDELRLTQTHLEQINSNTKFREIAKFFESIRYLHLVPQLLRQPEAFQGPGMPDDPFGRNFLETIVKTSEKTRRSRLRRIESALREAVPKLKNLTDTKDETGVPHLEATYEHWRPNAGRQREDQFSDGTLRLIGLFWSLLDGEAPLLLEEPELSLHSGIVGKLPGLFHRLQRRSRRQIFVTTHSWELLSEKGIGGEEVIVLTPDTEGTTVETAASFEDVKEQLDAGLSIADAALPRTISSTLRQLDLSE
ncbi:MAG: AAA family ATPase [Acidobacteria bacterium]|nr:AAA family ATPase [Acidobacteriota bacterium]